MAINNIQSCPRLMKCPIVTETADKSSLTREKIKNRFCQQNHTTCTRYLIINTLGGEFVPDDLQPNQTKRAREIIRRNRDIL